MSYRYALAERGRTLATRPLGSRLRTELTEAAVGQDRVELDFSGIAAASHSFADEFVGRLAEETQSGAVKFDLVLTGATPEVERVIRRALDRRDVEQLLPV